MVKIHIYLLRVCYKKVQKRTYLMMTLRFFFSDFLYKGICYRYSFELHRNFDAIQMSTHNICLYKEIDKKYTGCNLKTMALLECALIGVCAVIRLNTVLLNKHFHIAYGSKLFIAGWRGVAFYSD